MNCYVPLSSNTLCGVQYLLKNSSGVFRLGCVAKYSNASKKNHNLS